MLVLNMLFQVVTVSSPVYTSLYSVAAHQFSSKLTCRYAGAAQVMTRLTLGEPPRGRHRGLIFVS